MSKNSFISQLTSKSTFIIGAILFATSIYFWMFKYPAHLAFNEQSQLFLVTYDYFLQFLKYPSGIAQYIGEFFTQFYYEIWWGAAIISALLLSIYALSYLILSSHIKKYTPAKALLALIPALITWTFMLDRFSLLAMPIALTVSLTAIYTYQTHIRKINSNTIKHISIITISILLYWLFGALSFLFAIYITLNEIISDKKYLSIIYTPIAAILPIIAYTIVPHPLQRLYTSNYYYKVMDGTPTFKYNTEEEDALLYSYFSRYKKWDAAIKRANKKMPLDMASRQILLHALAEKNLLLEKLFDYPILFSKDLISSQSGDMIEPTAISDIYFSLGMINSAELSTYNMQQLYFGQGTRTFQRMAECNIIKKDYRVAQKYINALKQTLFYKKWAEGMETMMNNEVALETHNYYGTIRERLMEETFYFSDSEIDNILAHTIKDTPSTNINFDYLVAYLILSNDLDKLAKLLEGNTQRMPKAVQEALVLHWMQNNASFDGMPWKIDNQIMLNAVDFLRNLNEGGNLQSMRAMFGNTYWFYNTFASHIIQ